MEKFKSTFATEVETDAANYITELIMRNYFKLEKVAAPTFPFWRAEYKGQSPEIDKWTKRYVLELIGVKQLLKKYSAPTIVKFYSENYWPGFKELKKKNQQMILAALTKIEEASKIVKVEVDMTPKEYEAPAPPPIRKRNHQLKHLL